VAKYVKIWGPFVISTVLTASIYKWGYALPGWFTWLTCLAVVSLLFGILAIRHAGMKFWSIAVVVVGLAIGQWWLLELALVMIGWKLRGFAP
jgi:hypothetical protein